VTSIAKFTTAAADVGRKPPAGAVAKAVRPPPGRAEQKPAGARKAPDARTWPEGASGLGAVSREPERQLWWSMPPPDWVPFGN
jgi:hypothetical protein